jgi:cellulose 1,4-beta-cellobiosidase
VSRTSAWRPYWSLTALLSASFMQWLDGQTGNITSPGNLRGPCSTTSGQPADIQAHNSDAAVTWSNIKYGEIGSTFL